MASMSETLPAESHADLIEHDEEIDSDMEERAELAKEAAEWIMVGMPMDPNSRRTRSPEVLMPSIERDSVDGQRRRWMASVIDRLHRPRFLRGSGVKDATSWYGDDGDDGGTGCLRLKGKGRMPPVVDDDDRFRRSSAPSPSSRRSLEVVYMDPGPSCGRRRRRREGWSLGSGFASLSPLHRWSDHEAGPSFGPDVLPLTLWHPPTEQSTPDCFPPKMRHRLSSIAHKFRRSSESSSPLTSGQTTVSSSSTNSVFSRTFDALISLGRRTSRTSGGSPNTESSLQSTQHVEDAEKS